MPMPELALRSSSRIATPYVPPVTELAVADKSPDSELPVGVDRRVSDAITSRPLIAVAHPGTDWPRYVLGACAALAFMLVLRLLVSLALLDRTIARAAPASPEQAQRVASWLALCGSRRGNIRLKISREISSPIAVGPLRPSILVPPSFFEQLSDSEIEQAGLHEAAHLARYDDYGLLLQRLIEALLAWHPAVRWVTRQMDLEREVACDDFVVESLHQPRSYASCLTRLAELAIRRRPSLLASGAIYNGTNLTQRVEMLLDQTRHTGTRLLRGRFAGLALVPLLLALGAARIPELIAFAQAAPAAVAQHAAAVHSTPAVAPVPAQAAAKADDATVAEWIKANAVPLTTAQAGHGFADMQPLKKIIGNARIVSLGEATHGTREFFQMKHRMVEFLATQMGFTIVSIEANMPEAYRLNDYVLNGRGDPGELLKGMYFWTWDTKEVLEMIQWMREFNQSGKGRIEFTGFDMQTPDVALKIVKDFAAAHDRDYLPEIEKAPVISRPVPQPFTSATGTFPVDDAAGKTVRFSADIKTEDVTEYAGLWWRADEQKDGKMQTSAFKNLGDKAPKGTSDWAHYELEIAIRPGTKNINFGPLLAGGGTAWFDNLKVTIDDVPYTKDEGFHLIYRGASLPKGNFPTVTGYAAAFMEDPSAGRSGTVLRLMRTAPLDSPKTAKPNEASAAWQTVVDHLESARSSYLSQGVSAKDADWAIQNARVVLQCMQMKANEITRDRAMADNVKWILDHSPQAKIVLWAHNGHVGTRDLYKDNKSMGEELRKMYGDRMRVFGFAFNEGGFQSIEQGKGLRKFTVPPNAPGSFDATLAASGIPIFALDLQHAPAGSAAGAWLKEPHKARSIGSMYSEDRAADFQTDMVPAKTFNAILFVENTSAAIPNGPLPQAAIVACAGTPAQTCTDKIYAVSFQLPAGWSVQNSWRWGEKQNTVALNDPQAIAEERPPSIYYQVYAAPHKLTADEMSQSRQKSFEAKVLSRQQGYADYHLRPGSCHARTVGGRAGWSCIGEFTDFNGTAMSEYLTWVDSENASALFFGFVPAAGLDAYMKRLDVIIETLQIP